VDLDARRNLIKIRLQMLCLALGKRVPDGTVSDFTVPFVRVLENFSVGTITETFSRAETDLERFPTPRALLAIAKDLAPSQNNWRYNYAPAERPDPETDASVNILLDPDPSCSVCRDPRSLHPSSRCQTWQDSPPELGTNAEMYRPQDCPEGRAFLATLRTIAGKSKAPPPESPTAQAIPDAAPAVPCRRWPHLIGKGILYDPD
jgi:hypothetical protein